MNDLLLDSARNWLCWRRGIFCPHRRKAQLRVLRRTEARTQSNDMAGKASFGNSRAQIITLMAVQWRDEFAGCTCTVVGIPFQFAFVMSSSS